MFIHLSMRSLTQHAHLPQTVCVILRRLMRTGCFSLCCVCVCVRRRPVLARACFSSPGPALDEDRWAGHLWLFAISWSGCVMNSRVVVSSEENQNKAQLGSAVAWPGLLSQDNKQTQQFGCVSHVRDWRDVNPRRKSLESAGSNNQWRVRSPPPPPPPWVCLCVFWKGIEEGAKFPI